MRILIIGAGAIGQAFARHFHRGGAHVELLVRPRQLQAAQAGLPLYPLNETAFRTTPDRLHLPAHTDQDEALSQPQPMDLIVLAVSSTALRAGDWLERLGRDRGQAGILGLTGSVDDASLIAQVMPGAHVAWAMLSVISFAAPLPGETVPEPGTAYWFPPLSRIALSGPSEVIEPVLSTLTRGGMPVRQVADVGTDAAFMSPILTQTIHALECAGWSFQRLSQDPELLPLAVQSMNESWALAEATTGQRRRALRWFVGPRILRLILWASRWVVPFSLEAFFRVHYTKVADQTVFLAHKHLESGAAHGIDMPAAAELLRRISWARSTAPTAPERESG